MYPGTHARTQPDKPAYVMAGSGVVVTYRELNERSNQYAHYLRGLGLTRGDTIAIVMENNPQFLQVCWGGLRSGLYYTPINWHLSRDEMAYVVKDSKARVIFTSVRHVETALAVVRDLPDVKVMVVDGEVEGTDGPAAVEGLSTTEIEDESEGFDMIYSAGTTGRPKGGKQPLPDRSPADYTMAPRALGSLLGMNSETVYLSPGAPLYHAAPIRFTMAMTRLGGTCVIMERFDPLESLRMIELHKVTQSQWVPTMFVRLLRLPEEDRNRYDLSSHQVASHAAAPCPISVKQAMLDWWGPIIHEYYSGSEGGITTYISPQEWLTHVGSVGRPIDGKIHILDDDDNELPPGKPGVVFAEGARDISYHNDPEKTRKAHSKQGYTTVGDVGYLDEDGYLYLTDRKDYVIIVGGVNIYPQEIEDTLIQHPAVADVAVFGVPNEEFGEEIKAVVELTDQSLAGAELEQELIDFCKARISIQKCPRSVDFEPELPRSPAGKLYKRKLRDRYWEGHRSAIS